MGIETIILIIVAAIIGGYIVKGSSAITPSSTTPITGPTQITTSTGQVLNVTPAPVPPHLQAGARLLTDQQIAEMEASTVPHFNNSPGDKARFISEALPVLAKEQVFGSNILYNNCNGQTYAGPPLGIKVAQDGSLALGLVTTGAKTFGLGLGSIAGAAIPIAGFAIGAGLAIYNIISAHHKAAVANEQRLECQVAIPANESLNVIEQAVVSGTITIQQGQIALDKLYSDATAAAHDNQAGQATDTSGTCNAMCWVLHFIHAIILKKKNRYANLVS